MNHLHVKYLIAGGGVAGSAAVEAIRRHDPAGSVLFVGQEINRPYNRAPLSKSFLRRKTSRAALTALPIGWYAERHVELRTGRRLSHIDASRKCVTLDNGEEVSFDKLLLATGAASTPLRIPGADLPNVFYLRTLEDADRLLHAMDTSRGAGTSHATIIGSGLLGTELAGSLTQAGLHVDLIEMGERPWPRLAGENVGGFLKRYLEAQGVNVHCGEAAERIEGDGRVQRVVTSNGTIPSDFVVAAVGTTVGRELLRGTPIDAETAILVDDRCQTSVADIYAVGDCAAVLDPLFGKHRLLDHWDNARFTGNLAGTNMAGGDERYAIVNHFSSEVFDLSFQVWGEAKAVDHRLLRGVPNPASATNDFAEIGIAADGRVAQIIAVGRKAEHEIYRDWVGRRMQVNGNAEAIKDPQRDLAEIKA